MSKETCKSFEEMQTVNHNSDGTYTQAIEIVRGLGGVLMARPKQKDEGRFKVTKDKFYH